MFFPGNLRSNRKQSSIYWGLLAFLLMGFLGTSSLKAGFENGGKTGLSFLKVGVGARAAGMGEAYTAVVSDAFATYWNPAALNAGQQSTAVFMHNFYFLNISSDFAALQLKFKKSSIGFHVYSFNIGDIAVRTKPSVNPLETTSAHYLSLGISYARSFNKNVDIGLTVKYLFEKIYIESGSGFAVDVGFRARLPYSNFFIAGVLQNIGKMNELSNQETRLPMISRIGAMYQLPKPVGPLNALVGIDLVKPLYENMRFHLGTEFSSPLVKSLALRLGYVAGYINRNVSFGIAIQKSWIHLDYSFTPFTDNLENAQRISVRLNL